MKNLSLTLGLSIFLLNSTATFAQTTVAPTDDRYLQIAATTTELKSAEQTLLPPEENPETFTLIPLAAGVDPMAIADMITKLWAIVEDGKPVVNIDTKNATALPNAANNNWMTLTGWKAERTITYEVSTKNLMQMQTIDLIYQVKLRFGGGVDGKGQYIATARVVPTTVDVLWGYNLDVSVEVPAVVDLSTQTDPLASINLDVKYKISTVLRSYSETKSFEVRGDGFMKDTTTGQVLYDATSR